MTTWPSSLRARLTLWYTALLAVPLIVFAIVCYVVFARALLARTDRFIGDALAAFSRELVAERRAAANVEAALRTTVDEVRFRDLHITILDSAARIVAATANAGGDSRADDRLVAALRSRGVMQPSSVMLSTPAGAYRAIARPLGLRGQPFVIAGMYAMNDSEAVLERIRELFAIAIPLFIVCAATGGSFLAKRSLAPVAAMAAQAAAISATNLHERLPVGGGDELIGLARVVNALLERLEHSFELQRHFMADASHELRTPAAILRAEADITLSREYRSGDEYRASVAVMRDAVRRLTRIVDDLFLLARADSGALVARQEALYLEELVHDSARAVRPVADERGVRITVGHVVEAPFRGDPDLLGRLMLNLLDNAIKHSAAGGTVDVGIERHDGRYEISVVDAGAGIPADARERVFERFFRADVARARAEASATSGAGLGLPIARRIAELHGGQLELGESRPGRTEFRLTLPAG